MTEFSEKLPNNTFLLIHIPKTAGTSFRSQIEKKLKCIFEYGADPKTSPLVHETIDKGDLTSFVKSFKSEGFEAVYGHFEIAKYQPIVDDTTKFATFLRHPIQRSISNYEHFRRHYGYDKSMEEFFSNPHFSNQQSKALEGIELDQLFFIGITERYSDSIKLFNKLTNLEIKDVKINDNPQKKVDEQYSLDYQSLKLIESKNQKDLDLYCKAQSIFEKRFAEIM
ncbi:sulfotransferase family 2 domain-containing protein [Lyngbya sp. CCY1209]|uniref:sulfotransferase family 2 domain-containing protein n=1 Tax=Lyngbya sp. CCY1209 TaxID=2886103 RepID=UPI002D213D4B|nr:hypothetical protein [Lyngbya sp. CCY1209]MEB3884175.1 sulfotransferase family protein [Lyngbya sp. CCY1209]